MNIYFASQLFSPAQREFNLRVVAKLETQYKVFLPQRDGKLLRNSTKHGSAPQFKDIERVFKTDTNAIDSSDIIVAILEGPVMDDGVSWELGYAYAKGKLCYGLLVDDRQAMCSWRNPMIEGCLSAEFFELEDLFDTLMQYAERNQANRSVST